MSRLLWCVLFTCAASTGFAHFPDRQSKPVYPRIDCIGPIGNRLPMSYRRRYNRPSKIGGWLAYWAAPTSQEAMAWHNAIHRGNYKKKMPRTEMQYFYPKPWEALKIGPRVAKEQPDAEPVQTETTLESKYGDDLPESVMEVLQMNEQPAE